ncbi:DnaJ domain-containing protein [Desulfobotulus mexicanus]|uniref:DnaJ domain-containing protein n=1 Tax=Desulfobotulus mexicanus TaxID=2586642 RepID=A0A5S5ME64_9BACT|nr:DnaJ domain-containing protein [Desulfobotulus mexicanus]TYT73987.1 DnaJ domain-containing protein [Desulfobotulus mexicanus]
MFTNYRILGVTESASDQEIRKAYLEKIREHTPEKDPDRFRIFSESYDSIKDQRSRIHNRLFGSYKFRDGDMGLDFITGEISLERRRPTLKEILAAERGKGPAGRAVRDWGKAK